MNKYIVTLTKEERELRSDLASKGEHKSQRILNALILQRWMQSFFDSRRSVQFRFFVDRMLLPG
jgi:hypothetical protein